MGMDERLAGFRQRHAELSRRLTDPAVIGDPNALRELSREHSRTSEVVSAADELEGLRSELTGVNEMLEAGSDDPEMTEMARAERAGLEESIRIREESLARLIAPRDPLDDRDAVVEVRAGTGGDEAALFAGDLFRMYQRFADRHGWKIELLDQSEGAAGGVREAVFVVRGDDAFGQLRHESGVHRVQRVPSTESQGRIHTSAATVAVLPEAEAVDVDIRESDLRIDVYRSSGPGGQSVNTTDSAVRITHEPTGVVVTCQDEKSQHKNKDKAMRVLRSRLLDRKIAEQEAARARERKMQVGTGDRSGKIRTYNFPQSRVTDHRIGYTTHALQQVLDGELDEMVDALRSARREEMENES